MKRALFDKIIAQANEILAPLGDDKAYVVDEIIDDDEDDECWFVKAMVIVPKRKPMWVNLRATDEGLRSLAKKPKPGSMLPVCARCQVRLPNWVGTLCVQCEAKQPKFTWGVWR